MIRKRLVLFSIIVVGVFAVSFYMFGAYGFCDDTDLKIDIESITQRQYAGNAVTDGYGIEILTEEGYSQAEKIAAMREKQNEMTRGTLFSKSQSMDTNEVAKKTLELGLFGSDYSAVDTQDSTSSGSYSTILTILILIIATSAGVALAFVWQRRKGANAS